MSQEKRSTGFRTSSKALEDAFDKIQGELSKKEADWQALEQDSNRISEIRDKDTKLQFDAYTTGITLGAIAKLGIQVTEIHKRLANLEKIIDGLKSRLL